MKVMKLLGGLAVTLATCGMIVPQASAATSAETKTQPAILDVALQDGGILVGQVVDGQGLAQKNVPVTVTRNGQEVAQTTTDAKGEFKVNGLQGGVYQVATAQGSGTYRFWTARTAPPSAVASKGLLIVDGTQIVRGANGELLFGALGNPWVLTGAVAAGIAIPLALDSESGS